MVLFRGLGECFAHPGNSGVGAAFYFLVVGPRAAFKLGGGIVTADYVQYRKLVCPWVQRTCSGKVPLGC